MNDDHGPQGDDAPVVRPDPAAEPAAAQDAPWHGVDGAGQLSLGILGGLLLGAVVAFSGLGLILAVRSEATSALVLAASELAVGAILVIQLFRRRVHGVWRGFLIGFSVALLLSSMCYGAIGLSK